MHHTGMIPVMMLMPQRNRMRPLSLKILVLANRVIVHHQLQAVMAVVTKWITGGPLASFEVRKAQMCPLPPDVWVTMCLDGDVGNYMQWVHSIAN